MHGKEEDGGARGNRDDEEKRGNDPTPWKHERRERKNAGTNITLFCLHPAPPEMQLGARSHFQQNAQDKGRASKTKECQNVQEKAASPIPAPVHNSGRIFVRRPELEADLEGVIETGIYCVGRSD